MRAVYFDSAYVFKLQCAERGSSEVRALAAEADTVVCAIHGRIEFASACHRKLREGAGTRDHFQALLAQVEMETRLGALRWLPITDRVLAGAEAAYRMAPSGVYLRAADALHLACAADHGFTEIWSNDRHLLAAAGHFGMAGRNVIPDPPGPSQ